MQKSFLGKLSKPIISIYSEIECKGFCKCVYSSYRNALIISGYDEGCLKLYNSEDKLIDTIKNDKIKKPWSLYLDKFENLYLCDLFKKPIVNILVFDSTMKFVYEFELKKWRNLTVDSIVIDEQNEINFLYVSSRLDNKIGMWNSINGEFLKFIDIDSPHFMCFSEDKLFVSSSFDSKVDKLRKVGKSNSNCIFVLNKYTHDIVRKICNPNWQNPIGLLINNGNIMTIARCHNEDNNVLQSRCYLVLDMNGGIKEKIKLEGVNITVNSISDLLFYENKIVYLTEKSIKFIEL